MIDIAGNKLMIKKVILFLLYIIIITNVKLAHGKGMSETKIIIVGEIIDKETKEPLEFSSIIFYTKKDSVVIAGGISDDKGKFSIEVNQTAFFIKVEFIGYGSKIISEINLKNGQQVLDLGTIELEPSVETMEAVEIRVAKSSVMLRLDKRVFNVGKDLVSAGGTAEDILRNVPGVSVDVDGSITLRSSTGVLILLNGRSSSLLDSDNSAGLRQIQASQIDKIEVITNPSSRYEAEGTAGIINIILKSSQEKGLNGSVNANIGHPENFGLGANINYNKNKFNWFTGIGAWYVNRPGTGSFRNQFYDLGNPDNTLFSNMDRTHERKSLVGFFKFGADYRINSKNTLMTSLSLRSSNDNNPSQLIYKDALGSIDNIFLITQRDESETEEEGEIDCFLTHKKVFDRKGHQLITEVQYENRTEEEVSIYKELFFDKNNAAIDTTDFNQLSNNEEGNKLFIVKSDYIQPFGKESKFELGFQSSFRSIGNDYKVRELLNNVEIPDTNFTNNFKYEEIIHGIYGNVGSKVDKFSFQFGLRIEHSDVITKLLLTNENNPRNYYNFFPSAFFTYDLSSSDALQLSYSRRIQRPSFWDLNPFFTLRDRRNIFRGNPNIEPELTDSYELGYVKYWEKGSLSSIAYYRKTDDVIKRLQRVDINNPERTITQAENLDFKRNFGVEITYFFSPKKWYLLNGDVNIYHSNSQGTYEYAGESYSVGGKSFSMKSKVSARFSYWEKVTTQFTISYEAPRRTTQGINKSTTGVDIASSIDLLKSNGTLTLSVGDLFNTRRRRSISEDETFISEDNFLWQSRSILLSFNYRFNQQKNRNHIYSFPKEENEDENF